MDARILLVSLVVLTTATAGPINLGQRTCSTKCTGSEKFKYTPGTTYSYSYDGSVTTKINGAMEEGSGLRMTAVADIEVLDKCNHVLKLRNVRLEDNKNTPMSGSTRFGRSLEEKPLHFSFQDGRIEELCTIDEEKWVLNIKRGVLSAFQNSMEDLKTETVTKEIDVAGECDAEYKLGESAWRSFSIVKTKDLLACTSRQAAKTALQATPYKVDSGIQTMPLTKGTHMCQHDIHNNGYLLKSDCQEEHIFRPFSKESSGATTSASHRLEFTGEAAGVSSSSLRGNYRRTNLLYEHEPEQEKNSRDLSAAMDSLKTICEQLKTDVRPSTPALFAELVYKLKDLDARSLSKLYRYVNNNGVCKDNHATAKKFFMDAIPMVGSTASVSLIGDLVSQRTIQGSEAEMWLSSLAFIQQPTQKMLTSVKTLIESVTATKTTFLSGSALVNSYCKDKPSCSRDPTVQLIAATLEGKLNYNCRLRGDKDRDRIMMTLKALGNMGHAPRATQTITRCMMENTNAVDIRLAAIDALRRQPCDPDRARVLTLFSDANEDAEIRIAAYLASMQCATPEVVDAVTNMLKNEKVNQVGSFVWTHLTNLKETSCPLKQDLRKILENKYLQKEFDLDARKYSRNFEGSFFSEMMNAGANVDGNLVWSQKSFVPRSAMMNLTVDLFGQSVNLLEVGGRVEGMEHMLETYFGKKGYFPESSVGDMLKRNKRSASDDKINRIDNQFNSKRSNDLKGSMYFRVFGHEISYMDFAGLNGKTDFNVLEMLIKLASNHEINFSKSVMFLDTSVTIPTILGMPLKLSINGTATVNMRISGKMDVRQAFASPRSMDVTGSIKPSGAVAISSLMSIDAFVARIGLKMVTTLHSSSAMDGSIKMEDGQVFITKINMPRDKIEILNAENKFYLVKGDDEVEQSMPSMKRITKSKCTSNFLTQLTGVQLCGEVSHPAFEAKDAVFAPLMGPSRTSVALYKRDTLTGYEFEARFQNRKDRTNGQTSIAHVARVAFNTPGSKVNREMSVDFMMNRGERKLNFNLISPWTKVTLNGEITNTEESKQANLRLLLNDKDEYAFLSQLNTMSKNGRTSFSPNIEIRMPNRKPITVSGMLDYMNGRKVDVNLVMENLFTTPVTVKGGIEKDIRGSKTRFSTNMDIKSHYLDTKISGYIDNKPSMYKSRMTVDYRMMNAVRQRLSLNYKIRNVETVSLRKISVDTAVQTTQWPEYNFELSTDVQKTSQHAESSLSLRYGADETNPNKRIAATAIINYDINGDKVKADGSAKLNFPAKNIDFNMKVNHNHDPKGIQSKSVIEYQTGKTVNFEMNLRDLSSKLLKLTGDVTLELPSRVLAMSHQIEERQPREYHHNMFLQWQRGKQLQTTSMYKVEDRTHTITSNIQLPERRPINVNAFTTLDIKNFAGSVQVDYERKIYGLDLAYNFNSAVEQLVLEGRFDARHPARRVTGFGSIKRASDEYSTKLNVKWDADRDETKAVAIEGAYKLEYVYQGKHHQGKILVSYPGRQATMTMDTLNTHGKYQTDAEVQWEAGKKIAMNLALVNAYNAFDASIKFTSPFQYIESLGAAVTHRRQHSEINTNGEITWAVAKTIKIETTIRPRSAKNFETTASIATPFSDYRMMTANAQYSLDDSSFSGTIQGAVENRKVGMTLSGSIRNGVNGNMKIEIPLLSQPITAKFSHKNSAGLYDTSAEMTWSTKKMNALLKIKPVSWSDMEFTLSVNTPFQFFTTMTVQGIHKLDNEGLRTKVFGQYDAKKIGLEIAGKLVASQSSRNIEGTVHLNSPFQGFEDMSVSLKHSDDGHRFSSAADATWDDKKIGAALYMTNSMNGWNVQSTGRLQVVTPFEDYERAFYNWRHNNDHNGITSSHSLTIRGLRYTMTVGGKNQMTNSRGILEGKLNIQTPHEMAKNLNAEMTFQLASSNFKTSVLLGRTETEKIELGVEGSYDSRKNFMGSATLDLSAVLDNIPAPLKATVNGQMNAMPYTGHVEGVWAKEKLSLDFSVSPISWRQFEASASMTTPFAIAKTVGLKATSSITDNSLAAIITSQYNGKQAEMHVHGSNKGNNNMINLSGDIKIVNPYTSDVSVGMKFIKQTNKIATTISASYDTFRTEAGFDTEYDMSNGIKTKGTAAIVLPIFGEQKMAYTWDLNTDMKTTFNSQNTYSWNDKSIVANADLTLTNNYYGSTSKAHVTIQTPMEIARVLKIDLDHTKRGNSFTSNLRFSRNRSQSAAFNMVMVMDTIYNAEGTGKLTINSMEPITISVRSSAEKTPYSGHLELSWARQKKIGIYGTVEPTPNAIETSFTFTSPFEYFEKVAMKVSHKTEGNAMNTAVTVEYQPGKIITLSTNIDNSRKHTGTIVLTTPSVILRRFAVTYEHEGSLENFHHLHNVEFQGMYTAMSMSNTLNYYGSHYVTGNMHFKSQFEMFQDVKINFNHREEKSAYTTTADIQLEEGKKVEITSILEKSDNPRYTLTLKSPYEYLRSMNVNFEHKGQFPYSTTTGRFEMQNRFVRASVSGEVKIEGLDSISASLRLITPIKYYEHMFLSLNHGKVRGEWRTSLEGQTSMRKRMNVKTTFNMESNVEGSVTINIPYLGMESLVVSFEHEGSMTQFTLKPKFEMKWQGEKTELDGEIQVNGINDIKVTINGDTPYSGHQTISISAQHSTNGPVRTFTATMNTPAGKSELINKITTYPAYKIEMEIKTPYKFLQSLNLDMEHSGNSLDNFHNKIDFSYINLLTRVVMTNDLSIRGIHTINGKFHLTSPIKHLEVVNAAISTKQDGDKFITIADIEYAPRKQILLKSTLDLAMKKLEMTLTTPFEQVQEMGVKIQHDGDNESPLAHKAMISLNKEQILNSNILMNRFSTIRGKTEVFSHVFTIDHQLSSDMINTKMTLKDIAEFALSHEATHGRYKSKMALEYKPLAETLEVSFEHSFAHGTETVAHIAYNGQMGESRADASMKINGLEMISGNLHIVTPLTKDIEVIVDHKTVRDSAFQSSISVISGNNKLADIKSIISISYPISVDVTIETPFDYLRTMTVKMNHAGQPTYFTNTANILIATASDRMTLDSNVRVRGLNSIDGRMNLKSSRFDDVVVSVNHGTKGQAKIAKIAIEMSPTKKIELSAEYKHEDDLSVLATLRTPWDMMKEAAFELDVAEDLSNIRALLRHNKLNEPITFTSELKIEETMSGKIMSGKMIFTSGCSLLLKRIDVAGKLNMNGDNHHTEGTMTWMDLTTSFIGDVTVENLNKMSGTVALKTPYKRFSDIVVSFQHDGDLSAFTTKAAIDVNNKGNVQMTASWKASDMEGNFELQTPVMETIKIGVSHKSPSYRKYDTKMNIAYGTKEVSVESMMTIFSLSSITGSVMIKTPCPSYPFIKTSFSHHGELKNFRNSIAVESAEGTIRASSEFRLDDAINANFKIETPWAPLSKVSVGMKHTGDLSKCQSTLTIGSNYYGDMEMTSQWSKSPMEAEVSLSLPSYEKMSTVFKYQKLSDVHQVEFEAKYGAKLFNYQGKFTFNSLNDFSTEMVMKTPWKFSDISFSHKHTGDMKKFTTLTTVETNIYNKIELSTMLQSSPMELTMNLKTPWTGIQNVNAKFSHRGNLDAFNTALNVNADGEKIAVITADWNMSPIRGDIMIYTPFHDAIKATFSHQIQTPTYKTNAEVSYGRFEVTLASTVSVRSPTDVEIEVSTTSPSAYAQISKVVYSHLKSSNGIAASLNVENNRETLLDVNAKWSLEVMDGGGKLTIRSTLFEPIVAQCKLSESLETKKFTAQYELSVSVGVKVSAIKINFDFFDDLWWNGVISLKTPVEEYSSFQLAFNHRGDYKRLISGVEFTCSKTGKTAINVEWDYGTVTTAKVAIEVPTIDKITATVKHEILNTRTYKTDLTASYGSIAYAFNSDMNIQNANDMYIRADLKTPIPTYNFVFTHKGDIEHFKCNMKLESEGGVITEVTTDISIESLRGNVQVATSFDGYRTMSAVASSSRKEANLLLTKEHQKIQVIANKMSSAVQITVETPFNGFEKMHAKLRTSNIMTSSPFTATASVMYMTDKEIALDLKLVGDGGLVVSLSLATPFEGAKRTEFDLGINGKSWKDFNMNVKLTNMKDQTIGYSMKFNMGEKIELSANLETPFEGAEMSTLTFTHDGKLENFKTNAKLTYMRNQIIEGDLQFAMNNKIELTGSLRTPFTGAERTEVSFNHDGSLTNFNTVTKIMYMNNQVIEGSMRFTMGNRIDITATLKTPFTGAEMTVFTFAHAGTLENFNTHAKFTYMRNQIIEGKVQFSMADKVELTATLETPFTDAEMSQLTLSHDGSLKSFKTNAKMSYMRDQVIDGTVVFMMGNKIELTATLKTPFNGAEMTELAFVHNGDVENFNTNAKITYMRNQVIASNIQFNMGRKIELIATLRTPFTGAEMTQVAFSYEGELSQFNTNAKVTYMGSQTIEAKMQFSVLRKIELSATLKTPFTGAEMSEFVFSHDGPSNNFNTNAKLTYMRSQIIEGQVQFNMDNKIELTANLKTPFSGAENSRFIFSHDGSLNTFTTTAKLYARSQEVLFAMTFNNADKIDFTASLKTPFDIIETVAVEFNHEGTMTNFKNGAKLTYLRDQINIEYNIELNNGFSVILKTPFSGAEYTELTLNHEGDLWNFDTKTKLTYMRNQIIEYNMKFNSERQYQFTANLKTPFSGAEKSVFTLTHSGELTAFRTNAKLTYQQNQVVEAIAHFSMDSNIAIFAQLRTPFAGIETTEFTLTHHNGYSTYRTEVKLDYMPYKRIEGSFEYSLDKTDLEVNAQLKTPFTYGRHTVFTLKHKGGLENFNTNAKLTYSEKEMTAKVNFKSTNMKQIAASVEVTTPFKVAEKMSAEYTHNGDASRFECNAAVQYNEMPFTGKLNFQQTPSMDLEATVSTPFEYYKTMTLKFNHDGVMNQFTQLGQFNIMDIVYNYKLSFSNEGIRTIALDTEIKATSGERFALTANHNMEDNKIESSFVSYVFEDKFSEGKLSYDGDNLHVDLTVPLVQMVIDHEGSRRQFKTNVGVQLANFFTSTPLKWAAEVTFNANDYSASLSLEAPFESFTLNHNGKLENFKTKASVKSRRSEHHLETEFNLATMTLLMKMVSPSGSVEINHTGFPSQFTNKVVAFCAVKGTYQIETKFNLEREMASTKITTPEMSIEASHTTQTTGFVTKAIAVCKKAGRFSAELNFNKNAMTANVNVNTPYGSIVLTHTGGIENFDTKSTVNFSKIGTYIVEAKFNLKAVEAKLSLTTPYGNAMISHNGPYTLFTTTATTNILGYNYGLDLKYDFTARSSIVKFNCPDYTWTGTWIGPITNFKYNTMQTMTNGLKAIMEVSFNMEKKITGSFIYRSPWKYVEHLALSFSHNGDLRIFETDGSVSWTTTDTITAHVDFRRSRRMTVVNTKLETPYTEKIAMNARYQGHPTEFRSSITADYGTKRVQAVAQYNKESATISLMTPFKHFESLSASYKMTGNNGYHAEISWAPRQKVMADVTYTIDGTVSAAAATGTLMIRTPFELVQSLSIELENRHSLFTYLKNVMKIELNTVKCWDTKAEIRIAADRVNVQAAMTIPYPTTISVKMFNSEKEMTADIDVTVNEMQVYLNAIHKDESTYYRVKRDSSIKLVVPARTMALTSSFDSSRYQSNHKVEITLDQERGKKVTYEGTFADRSRSYQKNYQGSVKLTTPLRTLKTTVTHTQSSNNFNTKTVMMWDADRNQDRKMEVDTVYERSGKKHNVAVTLTHPRLNKPISVRGEITLNKENFIYAGKTEVQYSSDPSEKLTLSGKVNDESYGRRQNYSMSMKVSHPKSLINVDMTSHIGNTDSKMSAGVEMNYLTARKSQENVLLRGEIDKLRKTISMKLRTPMKNIAIDGGMKQRQGVLNLYLTNTMDTTPYRHFLEVNTRVPSFSLKTTFAPGKMYSLSGTANTTTAKIESSRIYGRRVSTDGLASINLNGSKVLYTRLHWTPTLAKEIKEYATETYTNAKTTLTKTWEDVLASVTDEWTQHSNLISNTIPNVAAVASYMTEEADSLSVDGNRIKNEWNNMYYRNEFFMRNIDEYMTTVVDYIKEKATLFQFQVRRYAAELSRHYQAKMAMYRRAWDEKMGKLEETIAAIVLKFRPAWQSYAYAVIRSYQENSQKLRHRFEESLENMAEYKASLVNYLDDKFDFITYKMEPYFAKFGNVQETFRYYLLSDKQKTSFDVVKERIVSFFETAREEYKHWKAATTQKTEQMIVDAKAQITNNLNQILGHEYSTMVIDMAQQAVVDMKNAYSEYEIESKLKDLLKGAYFKLDDYARKQVKNLVKNYIRIGESGFTVFEPEHGRIEAKIFLPLEIKSLDQLPDLKLAEMKQELEKMYSKYKPSSEFSMWDVYYKYKPTSDVMNWIPPFKAHATLAHGKHFTTFDGTTFEFAGTCSYLLARDFGDANFTVIANYKEGKIESYTLHSNQKKIEIFPDFKLMVNDARSEMPFEYMNTTITRDETTIQVTNSKGVVFTYDTSKDIVTLDISGWYFGKTAGLFGLYDNEPSNDFIMPSHQIADDVQAFTAAWEVAPFCRGSRNLARTAETKPGSEVETVCKKYFESGKSIFRPCFNVVPVQNYYKRCVSDLEQDFTRKTTEDKACTVIQTYVAECKKAEVEIAAPEHCASCQSPRGGLMTPSENVTFTAEEVPAVNSADVIFVVEEKQCNKEVANKLSALASKMEKSLKLKGIKNNRFAVVAFGGHGAHNAPHAHTMEGQIFNDARKMNLINLDFHADGSNTDVLDAVSYATKYNFRAGVSKSIVLIPCSSCDDQKTSYNTLYAQLNEQDIVLHLMKEHDFQLKSNSPKSNYIFGIDANSAYTSKDVIDQVLKGDTALLRQVVVPKDSCVTLAHKTHGSFFSAQKLTTGRYSSQKAFLDVMGRRVAMGATVNPCQDCKCIVGENGNGRTICKSCPVEFVKLTPAKPHLLGHMGENPEVGPLATPPTIDFEEVPLQRAQASVRIVGQRRAATYRARQ